MISSSRTKYPLSLDIVLTGVSYDSRKMYISGVDQGQTGEYLETIGSRNRNLIASAKALGDLSQPNLWQQWHA